jgi:hypothetical protein
MLPFHSIGGGGGGGGGVLFCKLHYGFGGNRLPTLSKRVSFSEFIIDRYDVSV